MKKFLSLFLAIYSSSLLLIAQNPEQNTPSQKIELELRQEGGSFSFERSATIIDIDAYYNAYNKQISIISDEVDAGKVYIYSNGSMIGYSPEINCNITIPNKMGLCEIVIITEFWTAQGSF